MGWSHGIQKTAQYSVLPTFYKNTKVLGPLRPRPRRGLPGGVGASAVGGCPPEKGLLSPSRHGKIISVGVPQRTGPHLEKRFETYH